MNHFGAGLILFFILSAATFRVQGQNSLTNGLIHYYSFNGNARDAVGTSDGFPSNVVPTVDRFGNAESAFAFNGKNSVVSCSDAGFPSGGAPRTISLWVKFFSKGIANPVTMWLTSYGGTTVASSAFYSMAVWNVTPPYFVVGKAGGGDSPKSTGIITNVWYHLAITYTNGTAVLYVNGTNSAKASRAFNTTLNGKFEIGRFEGALDSASLHGAIDDVRIFNRALSANEIKDLFAFESQPHVPLTVELASVRLKWFGDIGVSYELQSGTDLAEWAPVRTIVGTGTLMESIEDTDDGKRFYRIVKK
jgi:hypothetical protein